MPIYFLNVLTWHLVTRSLGLKIPYRTNLKIWLISNTARYLPGGFWQYPSRIYLLSEQKVPKLKATAALLMEAFFNLLVGVLIVLTVLIFVPEFIKFNYIIWILFLIIISPLLMYFLRKKIRQSLKIFRYLKISGRILFFVLITIFFQYVFAGFALFILLNSFSVASLSLMPVLVGIFTASWLLGYLTIFAPSGLGVQEASIATLLSFFIPFSMASLVAIVFRIVLILAEVICLVLVFILLDKILDFKKEK